MGQSLYHLGPRVFSRPKDGRLQRSALFHAHPSDCVASREALLLSLPVLQLKRWMETHHKHSPSILLLRRSSCDDL